MLASGESPVHFELPEPSAVLDLTMSDGAVIRVRRNGKAAAPRIVFAHGNGFASDAYYPFWRHLLSDFELVVYDQRSHGWNPRHALDSHTQTRMADDMDAILNGVSSAFGKRRTAGIFHSLSSIVSLLHVGRFGMVWDALVLFDPPIAPPPGHRLRKQAQAFEFALHDWALQRQRHFRDPSELASHFKKARRLRRWVPGAAELMASAITRPSPGGGYELICPPEYEAGIYKQNAEAGGWAALPNCRSALLIVASDPDAIDADPPALVNRAIAEELGIRVVSMPDTGHLLPIERPQEVAGIVRDFLESRGFGD
jgi:pimeloyl-ACP methyl ester carboxylesterase